jgi:hypothetical protein
VLGALCDEDSPDDDSCRRVVTVDRHRADLPSPPGDAGGPRAEPAIALVLYTNGRLVRATS